MKKTGPNATTTREPFAMTLHYDYGLELTFLANKRDYTSDGYYHAHIVAATLSTKVESFLHWGHFEISSPILSTLDAAEHFYSRARKAIARSPRSPTRMSGGGHLHVSPKRGKWRKALVADILRDFTNRPWLNWIFNDPQDDESASQPDALPPRVVDPHFNWAKTCAQPHVWLQSSPNKVVGINYHPKVGKGTIEVRVFDAPRDWSEQRLHIEFTDHWLAHVARRFKQGHRTELLPHHKADLTYRDCVQEFNTLLTTVGLQPAAYQKFLRNMKTRYDYDLNRD